MNMKQILIEDYYGRRVEVTLDSVLPETKIDFIPDSVKEVIFSDITDDSDNGEFTHDQTRNHLYVDDKPIYTSFAGSWRVLPLDFKLLARIKAWHYCYGEGEALTQELFCQYYDKVMGDHYYSKWAHVYKQDIMAMIGYFYDSPKEGQKFCDMITQQVVKCEQRICGSKKRHKVSSVKR